jgi:hypothetical protein
MWSWSPKRARSRKGNKVFKKVWKILDLESRFVGAGGPVNPADLGRHLEQVHRGAGQVEQAPAGPNGPTQRTYTKLQRPEPLSKFEG